MSCLQLEFYKLNLRLSIEFPASIISHLVNYNYIIWLFYLLIKKADCFIHNFLGPWRAWCCQLARAWRVHKSEKYSDYRAWKIRDWDMVLFPLSTRIQWLCEVVLLWVLPQFHEAQRTTSEAYGELCFIFPCPHLLYIGSIELYSVHQLYMNINVLNFDCHFVVFVNAFIQLVFLICSLDCLIEICDGHCLSGLHRRLACPCFKLLAQFLCSLKFFLFLFLFFIWCGL